MAVACNLLYAELPFTAIKGLDDAVVDKRFSPVHGYIAYYGKVLENIRLYGNYGQLICNDAGKPIDDVERQAQLWRHPSFAKGKEDDQAKAESKTWEYPHDAIAALMQWLFPSPSGVLLISNIREDDPVGDLSRDPSKVAQLFAAIKNFENEKSFKEAVMPLVNNVNSLIQEQLRQAALKSAQASNLNKMNEFQTKIAVLEKKENKAKKDTDELERLQNQKIKLEQQIQASAQKDFASRLSKVSSERVIFVDILYQALVDDGTLGRSGVQETKQVDDTIMQKIYPPHIALTALIGYIWVICANKMELLQIYKNAGLLQPDISDAFLSHLASDNYSQDDYARLAAQIKATPQALTVEQQAFVGKGFMVYESVYPEALLFGQAYIAEINKTYTDCNETTLRNLFCLLLYHEGRLDVSRLDALPNTPKMQAIKKFFTEYPTMIAQMLPDARNAWSDIFIHLNDSMSSEHILNHVTYSHGWYEILYTLGIANFINVFARLTQDPLLSAPWRTEGDDSVALSDLLSRLEHLCTMLSSVMGKKIDWRVGNDKNITSIYNVFSFTIDNQPVFKFQAEDQAGHVDFVYIIPESAKWVDEVEVADPALSVFFKKGGKIPFYAYQSYLLENNMDHWGIFYPVSNVQERQVIARIQLRLLYKCYKNLRFDHRAQSRIFEKFKNRFIVRQALYPFFRVEDLENPMIISWMKYMQPALVFFPPVFCRYFAKHRIGEKNINMFAADSNNDKLTVLMKAAQTKNSKYFSYSVEDLNNILLLYPDPNLKNEKVLFALLIALHFNWREDASLHEIKFEKIKLLLSLPTININQHDFTRNTSLMKFLSDRYFVKTNSVLSEQIVDLFLETGKVDFSLKNNSNKTLLDIAYDCGVASIVQKIQQARQEEQARAEEQNKAATKIQKTYRGSKARQQVTAMRSAADAQEKAAIEEQRKQEEAKRLEQERHDEQARAEQNKAATKIQKVQRGSVARKQVAVMRKAEAQEQAAIEEQRKREEAKRLEQARAEQNKAATTIQKAQRGSAVRKQVEKMRQAEELAELGKIKNEVNDYLAHLPIVHSKKLVPTKYVEQLVQEIHKNWYLQALLQNLAGHEQEYVIEDLDALEQILVAI